MANIKDLKKRIKSTKGTYKITKAMKLVSAAKLSRAQQRIKGLKPYSVELKEIVRAASAVTANYGHAYFEEKNSNKYSVVLVISADKGLCGSYNSTLVKKIRNFTKNRPDEDFKFFYIGKKAKELLSKNFETGKHYTFEKSEPTQGELRKVGEELAHLFTSGEVGRVYLAYNIFHSAMSFESSVEKLLPFTVSEEEKAEVAKKYPLDFKYEPSAEQILDILVPEVYMNSINTALLDALAAEHGSRMVAMENATKNCNEMIKKLTLKMNKLRQAAITTELIEVVSGAESLNG